MVAHLPPIRPRLSEYVNKPVKKFRWNIGKVIWHKSLAGGETLFELVNSAAERAEDHVPIVCVSFLTPVGQRKNNTSGFAQASALAESAPSG